MLSNLKQSIIKAAARAIIPYLPETTLQSLFSGFSWPGEAQNPWVNYEQQGIERLAVGSPLIMPNINFIAASVSMAELEVVERDADNPEKFNPVIDHPLERLINIQSHEAISGAYAKWHQVMWLKLRGEAYWMLVKNRQRDLLSMVPIPAFMIKPMPWKKEHGGKPRLIAYYAYAPLDPRRPERLPYDAVCYHRMPNLYSLIRGFSTINPYQTALLTEVEAEKFDLDDYRHGLALSKIISLRSDMNQRDFLQAREDFLESASLGERFRVVRGGDVSTAELSVRRGEEGQNVHKRAREWADRVWEVPQGIRDPNATEASARVSLEVYNRHNIAPLLNLIAQDLTEQILWRFFDEDLRCQFKSTMPIDKEMELKERDSDRKVQTYDEARSELGLPPHPDPEIGNCPAERAGIVYETKMKLGATLAALPEPVEDNIEDEPTEDIEEVEDEEKAVKQAPIEASLYEQELTGLIEQATAGDLNEAQFKASVAELLLASFVALFLLGAGKTEATPEEMAMIEAEIDESAIDRLAADVFGGAFKPKDEGGLGLSILARVGLWVGSLLGVYELGKLFNQKNEYLEWRLGNTKEHCSTCLSLNGTVMTKAEWLESPFRPSQPNSALECGGWRCRCTWVKVKGPKKAVSLNGRNGKEVHVHD